MSLDREVRRLGDEDFERDLDRLMPPDKREYHRAFNRAVYRITRALGADLTHIESEVLRGYSEEVDAETLRRFRDLMPPDEKAKHQRLLLRMAYEEVERRGVDPYAYAEDEDTA